MQPGKTVAFSLSILKNIVSFADGLIYHKHYIYKKILFAYTQ